MYLRLTLAIAAAVLLAGTHWKAYHAGRTMGQAEYNAAVAAATERYRQREQQLADTVEKLDHDLQKQKARNAALDRAHAERLREYQAALGRAAESAPAAGGTAGPFASIAGQCARALADLDQYARGLAATAGALQSYAAGVCVTGPAGR